VIDEIIFVIMNGGIFLTAIHNFHQDAPYRIKLMVGEAVHLLEENGGWFFGYSTKNRAVRGIFPKSYIHIKECIVDKTG
jgi:hypothetical protein